MFLLFVEVRLFVGFLCLVIFGLFFLFSFCLFGCYFFLFCRFLLVLFCYCLFSLFFEDFC